MRKLISFLSLALILGALSVALPSSLSAQDADPPGRVARLNFIQGSVSYQVSGDSTWVDADPNRPLTVGDNLWADKDSRGEVHIGSTAIRLSSETGISFLTLDDRTIQLQLAQGRIEVHSRNFQAGDAFEIDTPNLSFTLTSGGEYTIATDPNGSSTTILVREGQGQVTGGGDSWDLRAGEQYTFNGTDQVSYDAMDAPGFDDFEAW
jgi:FecR protein